VDLVRDQMPDAVVSLDMFVVETLERDSWFKAHYRRIAVIPLTYEFAGGREVLVYIRASPRASEPNPG
jgi:hypothetical protein